MSRPRERMFLPTAKQPMAEKSRAASYCINCGAYFGLMLLLMLLCVLPFEITPGGISTPRPDLLVAITLAWVMLRPQFLPTPLVAAVFLLSDILFIRPLGLWTALMVLTVEFLRARERASRELPFATEWAMVSLALLAATCANWLILFAFLVENTGPGPVLLRFMATMLAYPLVVLLAQWVFGVRKMAQGAMDEWGRRI